MDQKMIACAMADARSAAMAQRLSAFGFDVVVWGNQEWCEASKCRSLPSFAALADCHAVVLPTPSFDGQGRLHLGGGHTGEAAEDIFGLVGSNIPIFAGLVGDHVQRLSHQTHTKLIDYMQEQELQWRNAIPTAEGAIFLAMQRLNITLHGSHVAVLGYGRIATVLSERLAALGAKVTVAARNPKDLVRVELAGYRPLPIKDEHSLLPLTTGYDVIFNTIPYRILTPTVLSRLHAKTLLVELASAPGGWDASQVDAERAIYAPGIPGKYAPKTAGDIVARTIYSLLKEAKNP